MSTTPWMSHGELIALAQLVESSGFDSFWLHDYGLWRDVFVELTICALNTERIGLGVAVTNPYTRHPAVLAATSATIDEISAGRMKLGLGSGGQGFLNLLNLDGREPLVSCREAVAITRMLLRGGPARFRGRKFSLKGGMLNFPARKDIPIYLAATGPRMLRLAGEIADGVIINVGVFREGVKFAVDQIREGSAKANRDVRKLDLVCRIDGFAVSDDRQLALDAVRPALPLLVGNAPRELLKLAGVKPEEANLIKKAYYEVSERSASDLITDEMVEKFTVAGNLEECTAKFKVLEQLGITHAMITPIPIDGTYSLKSTLELISKKFIRDFN